MYENLTPDRQGAGDAAAGIARRFNLGAGSRVAFEEEADGIKVRPVRKTIVQWAGTLRSPQAGLSDAEVRRRVKKAVAARTARELAHG